MQIKTFWRLLLILALSCSGLVVYGQAETALTSGKQVEGRLGADNLTDTYTFETTANSILTVDLESDESFVGFVIVDQQGQTVIEAQTIEGEALSLEDVLLDQTGIFLVTVFSSGEQASAYTLTLTLAESEELAVEPPPEATEEAVTEDVVTEESAPASREVVTTLPALQDVLLNSGMEVRLQWDAPVDLNLEVRDPRGGSLYFDNRSTEIGGRFGFDANGLCEVISDVPVETATWQSNFLPLGSYEVLVFYRQDCEGIAQAVPFTLTVTVNGNVLPVVESTIVPPANEGADSVYLANFIIESESQATLYEGGAYPDTAIENLPATFETLQAQAIGIALDEPVAGALFEEQDYVVYAFEAVADDIITASINATSRNLDTLLQLVDPNGNLLTVNDDANGSTNSTIANQRILQDGTYLLIATRYGKDLGGTEGEFTLNLSQAALLELDSSIAGTSVPDGDIQVYLTWNNNTDLQLLVRDPVGQSVYDDVPQINSGGILAENGNINCTVSEGAPLSYIYWPTGLLRPGTYEIEVRFDSPCDDNRPTEFTLTTVVAGQIVLVERRNISIGDRFVTTFTINSQDDVTAGIAGFPSRGITGDTIVGEERLPILPNVPVQGAITMDKPLDVYTFSGEAGQIITITMQANSGTTLDTNVFLLDADGIQLSNNDDAPPGSFTGVTDRTTNSLISGFVLPADGEYLIVASRFATIYGGTTGSYQLQLQVNEP